MAGHMASFFLGFLLDLLLGDPYFLPHPVRLMGKMIAWLEKILLRDGDEDRKKFRRGIVLAAVVPLTALAVAALILCVAYRLHPAAGIAVETVMTYQILAVKCLKSESMKVFRQLENRDLAGAKKALSMIVGRDVEALSEEGVVKAAVETVAENTSDGVIAPMLFTAIGGPALGFFYKAVNTMDSMVGYKNEKYLYFGRAAAKLDDGMNFIPARLCACLMILSAFLGGRDCSGRGAWEIWRRDRKNHASPNSAQTEAACAGALGLQLAGDARYFGRVVHKPTIGDALRQAEPEDIRRANRLLYVTAWLGEAICLLALLLLYLL